jgi:hypothetical protein
MLQSMVLPRESHPNLVYIAAAAVQQVLTMSSTRRTLAYLAVTCSNCNKLTMD